MIEQRCRTLCLGWQINHVNCENEQQIRGSIVVSISARHPEDPGSIPGRGDLELRGLQCILNPGN